MASLGLRFNILSRGARDAEGDIRRVGGASGAAGAAIGGLAKIAGGAVVGALAGVATGFFNGFKEASSYQQILRQLEQTIRSTGGAAGVSVGDLKAYAGQLESLSGVDEELILNSQNVLATFTGIRNEAGKGNDIFNQASLAALNLSTTLGGDLKGASVQVGKALNDPVKGITALGKAGVSFTKQQKEQIKTLVKNGDTLGAQKIILGELSKEFGGAAKAAGSGLNGSIARLKDTVSDTFRDMAIKALPTVQKLADKLAKNLPGAIARTGEFLRRMGRFFQAEILPRLKSFAGFIREEVLPRLRDFGSFLTGTVFPALSKVGRFLAAQLMPVFKSFGKLIKENVIPAVKRIVKALKENKALFIAIGAVIGGFIAVVVVVASKLLQVLFPAIGKIIEINSRVIGIIGKVVAKFTEFIGKLVEVGRKIGEFVGKAVGKFTEFVTGVSGKITEAVGFVKGLPGRAINALSDLGSRLFNKARAGFGEFLRAEKDGLVQVVSFLAGLPGRLVGALASLGSRLFGKASSGFGEVLRAAREKTAKLVEFIGGLPGKVVTAIGDLGSTLYEAGKSLIAGLIRGIKDAAVNIPSEIGNFVTDQIGRIPGVKYIPGVGGLRAGGSSGTAVTPPPLTGPPINTRGTWTADLRGGDVMSLLAEQNRLIAENTAAIRGEVRTARLRANTAMAGVRG